VIAEYRKKDAFWWAKMQTGSNEDVILKHAKSHKILLYLIKKNNLLVETIKIQNDRSEKARSTQRMSTRGRESNTLELVNALKCTIKSSSAACLCLIQSP
jgi:hypothetical protein